MNKQNRRKKGSEEKNKRINRIGERKAVKKRIKERKVRQ
jgi:hypothetical protein